MGCSSAIYHYRRCLWFHSTFICFLGCQQACVRMLRFILGAFISPVVCASTIATTISAVQSFATTTSTSASTASISPSVTNAPAFVWAIVGVARYTLIPAQFVSIMGRSRSASTISLYEAFCFFMPIFTAPVTVSIETDR
ncbi:hypothetical protein Naga_101765g1 [Nannochloropsis gaditana]|uniref:Uncharacterized protein n=1 Tax=Nannochloropsis gaditana TaxID=72520 RepID=W7T9D3_9STRA|nr:hypothetical protein Naga_101765g1 [Nannochloropsis gaditana]